MSKREEDKSLYIIQRLEVAEETYQDMELIIAATGLPLNTIMEGLIKDFMTDHRKRLEKLLRSKEQAKKVGINTILDYLERDTDL